MLELLDGRAKTQLVYDPRSELTFKRLSMWFPATSRPTCRSRAPRLARSVQEAASCSRACQRPPSIARDCSPVWVCVWMVRVRSPAVAWRTTRVSPRGFFRSAWPWRRRSRPPPSRHASHVSLSHVDVRYTCHVEHDYELRFALVLESKYLSNLLFSRSADLAAAPRREIRVAWREIPFFKSTARRVSRLTTARHGSPHRKSQDRRAKLESTLLLSPSFSVCNSTLLRGVAVLREFISRTRTYATRAICASTFPLGSSISHFDLSQTAELHLFQIFRNALLTAFSYVTSKQLIHFMQKEYGSLS